MDPLLALDDLVSELHRIAVGDDPPTGDLKASDLARCERLMSLPRYARDPTAEAALADLERGLTVVCKKERELEVARTHFRLEEGRHGYMQRHAGLNPGKDDSTTTRRLAQQTLEPRLAFFLFQRGIEWTGEVRDRLDFGFRSVEQHWAFEVSSDGLTEIVTQVVFAEALRPGQRFFVFQTQGDVAEDEPRVLSTDPNHVLVGDDGSVAAAAGRPDKLVVVYLGRDYHPGEPLTIGLRRVGRHDRLPGDSGVFVEPVAEVQLVTISVKVPLSLASEIILSDESLIGEYDSGVPVERRQNTGDWTTWEFAPELRRQYGMDWIYQQQGP